ncbi:helix-turn-helix transcriptional regulator [Hydrogenophaga sp. NH-16]|uniref:helix-turn-helix domain-containing protein n=1 Tax=Hydrogenophaga sp. NH-16 TaxID=2184519 RepID=UPI000FDC6440|nr:helix-turn-helix transcriptional regulator [Hydrogenophaga sp. NH-16]
MKTAQNLELMRAFAAELKARRSELGISQEDLAHRSDVNRTFVAKLELAQNQPTLTVLLKLAGGLEVELPELLQVTLKRYKTEMRLSKKRVP